MNIYPAIDLYGGKAVRLVRGDYAQMTVYSDDPAALAAGFSETGASFLHMVDLEGAKSGSTPNLGLISEIAAQSGLFCEVGGGIRSPEIIEKYISAGVKRIILGSAAVTDPGFRREAIAAFGRSARATKVTAIVCRVKGTTPTGTVTHDATAMSATPAAAKVTSWVLRPLSSAICHRPPSLGSDIFLCASQSSSGLGLRPFKAATRVRVPFGAPSFRILRPRRRERVAAAPASPSRSPAAAATVYRTPHIAAAHGRVLWQVSASAAVRFSQMQSGPLRHAMLSDAAEGPFASGGGGGIRTHKPEGEEF